MCTLAPLQYIPCSQRVKWLVLCRHFLHTNMKKIGYVILTSERSLTTEGGTDGKENRTVYSSALVFPRIPPPLLLRQNHTGDGEAGRNTRVSSAWRTRVRHAHQGHIGDVPMSQRFKISTSTVRCDHCKSSVKTEKVVNCGLDKAWYIWFFCSEEHRTEFLRIHKDNYEWLITQH